MLQLGTCWELIHREINILWCILYIILRYYSNSSNFAHQQQMIGMHSGQIKRFAFTLVVKSYICTNNAKVKSANL